MDCQDSDSMAKTELSSVPSFSGTHQRPNSTPKSINRKRSNTGVNLSNTSNYFFEVNFFFNFLSTC